MEASTVKQWWIMIQADRNQWNKDVDSDDRVDVLEFAESLGDIYGWRYDTETDRVVKTVLRK
jgi:hypothetical protein